MKFHESLRSNTQQLVFKAPQSFFVLLNSFLSALPDNGKYWTMLFLNEHRLNSRWQPCHDHMVYVCERHSHVIQILFPGQTAPQSTHDIIPNNVASLQGGWQRFCPKHDGMPGPYLRVPFTFCFPPPLHPGPGGMKRRFLFPLTC